VDRCVKEAGQDGIVAPDLASPAFKADPYPFYVRLRAEAPVWRATLRDRRTAWLVTRYEDVARVLKDDAFAKDKLNAALRARRRGDWGHDDTARWTGLGGARLGQP
jgi:cytochrome P450